jgi:hypothetical protein
MSYIVITNLLTDTNVNIIFHISGQSYNLLTPRNVRWALILGRREYNAKYHGSLMSPIQGREARRIRSRHVCITWILCPTNMSKPPPNPVDIWNWLEDPPGSHHAKAQGHWGPQGVGRIDKSAKLTLWPPMRCLHVVTPSWLLVHSRGAHTVVTKLSRHYK